MKKSMFNFKRASLIAATLLCSVLLAAAPLRKELNKGWRFTQTRQVCWYPATVPGVVHTDLLANKLIDDPFYRLNERSLQWIDKEDWIYQTSFTLPEEMFSRRNIRLVFMGLDTYADVYLNDHKILIADNMFRTWNVEVKHYLKVGDNTLRVYFHSPLKVDIPKWEALPFHYEAGNDQSENGGVFDKKVSIFARKAGYHYGWDWGPRFVTSGIWRPIFLEAWDDARINDVFMRQDVVTAKEAKITTQVEVVADSAMINGKGELVVSDSASGKVWRRLPITLQAGLNKLQLPFTISKPVLWWSNGLGEPHLYHFRVAVMLNGKKVDEQTLKIGIRSLRIINEPDGHGHSFYVELNGHPVFAKGANYIPQDNFLPRVSEQQYRQTIIDAVQANMNMLRVWGGGTYEKDLFYDLCDQYGILVWQDFMFACSLYPAEGDLLENIRREAIDNVVRLRNHPCIALWCGNNECNDAWFGWGYKKEYEEQNPAYAQKIWKQYCDTYDKTLPQVVKQYAPGVFYWPSSPYSGKPDRSNDKDGDRHYWAVWQGLEPLDAFNTQRSRFFSEYGFQSFPDFESVQRYAPLKSDWNITSEVMMSHQRGGTRANQRIESFLKSDYKQPKDFKSFLYMSQLLQGDAMKTAIEAHRRDMPYCMGSLFWQHNDCWPVASWSSRDYYGRWKAQHYYARQAFRDLLVSPLAKNDTLQVYIVSDRLKSCKGTLEVSILKLTGEVLAQFTKKVQIEANSSAAYLSFALSRALKGVAPKDVFVRAVLNTYNNKVYDNNYFLVSQRDVNYPAAHISYTVKPSQSGYTLTLNSKDCLARAVYVATGDADARFSDNYFDLLPGVDKTIQIYTSLSIDQLKKQLEISSYNNE